MGGKAVSYDSVSVARIAGAEKSRCVGGFRTELLLPTGLGIFLSRGMNQISMLVVDAAEDMRLPTATMDGVSSMRKNVSVGLRTQQCVKAPSINKEMLMHERGESECQRRELGYMKLSAE